MSRKRLALVAFKEGEGPWVPVKGDEQAVVVGPLLAGEEVGLEVEGLLGKVHCKTGVTPVSLPRGKRYRFVKTVPKGNEPSKTSVEMIINEPSSS